MHINELPFDILSLLLKYTVGMQAQSTKNWKHTIQLLGVCRKWRQVASPWVNYWAFIECYESLEDEPYDKDLCLPNSSPNLSIISANSGDLANEPDSSHEIAVTNSPESVGQSQGAIWMSNIEFHRKFGSPHMVRRLELYLDSPVHLLHFLLKSASILQLGTIEWSGINALTFNIFSIAAEVDDNVFDYDDDKTLCSRAQDIACMISQSIQNVRELTVNGHMSHRHSLVSKAFATKLTNLYTKQLDALLCYIPMKFTESTMSHRIHRINLAVDKNAPFGSVKIPTTLLKTIVVLDAPLEFPWHIWQDSSSSSLMGTVDFANLEYFSLVFASPRTTSLEVEDPLLEMYENYLVNANNYWKGKVSAPKLKEIHLQYCPPGCPIFFATDMSKTLENLHLSGPIYLLAQVKQLDIDSVKDLVIYLDTIKATNKDLFYDVTNELFGNLKIESSASFQMMVPLPFLIDPYKLHWDNLTSLYIPDGMELATIIQILTRLPKLEVFTAEDFLFDAFMEDIGYIGSPQWKKLLTVPLETNITGIGIAGSFTNYTTHFVCNILHFIILRMQNLESIHLKSSRFAEYLKLLLKRSGHPHPHPHPQFKEVKVITS